MSEIDWKARAQAAEAEKEAMRVERDGLLDMMRIINRRASPKPDRTLGDCADELMMIADLARSAFASLSLKEGKDE